VADPKNFEQGERGGRQFISPVIIYRKCTHTTIYRPFARKKGGFLKQFLSHRMKEMTTFCGARWWGRLARRWMACSGCIIVRYCAVPCDAYAAVIAVQRIAVLFNNSPSNRAFACHTRSALSSGHRVVPVFLIRCDEPAISSCCLRAFARLATAFSARDAKCRLLCGRLWLITRWTR